MRRLKGGHVDKTTLVENLEYAADVLDNVYKVETMYAYFTLLSLTHHLQRIHAGLVLRDGGLALW